MPQDNMLALTTQLHKLERRLVDVQESIARATGLAFEVKRENAQHVKEHRWLFGVLQESLDEAEHGGVKGVPTTLIKVISKQTTAMTFPTPKVNELGVLCLSAKGRLAKLVAEQREVNHASASFF